MGCSNTKEYKIKGNQVANGYTIEDPVANGHVKNGSVQNGHVHNGHVPNGHVTFSDLPPEKKTRAIRGDLDQRKDAKRDREKKLKDRRNKTVQKAMLMSDKIMDERERLSLTGSRATSRATSRAGTPVTDRRVSKTSVFPLATEGGSLPPSEVDEDNFIDKQQNNTDLGMNESCAPDIRDDVQSRDNKVTAFNVEDSEPRTSDSKTDTIHDNNNNSNTDNDDTSVKKTSDTSNVHNAETSGKIT